MENHKIAKNFLEKFDYPNSTYSYNNIFALEKKCYVIEICSLITINEFQNFSNLQKFVSIDSF